AVTTRREAIDMGLDALGDLGRSRIDDFFAEILRPALPLQIGRVVDARLGEKLVNQFAIGALKGAHEGPLLGPAFPDDRFFLAAVMARTRSALALRGLSQLIAIRQ